MIQCRGFHPCASDAARSRSFHFSVASSSACRIVPMLRFSLAVQGSLFISLRCAFASTSISPGAPPRRQVLTRSQGGVRTFMSPGAIHQFLSSVRCSALLRNPCVSSRRISAGSRNPFGAQRSEFRTSPNPSISAPSAAATAERSPEVICRQRIWLPLRWLSGTSSLRPRVSGKCLISLLFLSRGARSLICHP